MRARHQKSQSGIGRPSRAAEGGDFRGQCNERTEQAKQGQVEAAEDWFRRAAASGTPGFLRGMAKALGQHPHPRFRAVSLQTPARCCEGGGAEDFFAYGRALALAREPTAGHAKGGPTSG